MSGTRPGTASIGRRRLLLALPLGAAVAAGGGFWAMLSRMNSGAFDPHDVRAPATGRRVPRFALPGLGTRVTGTQATGSVANTGFDSAELAAVAAPVLVNFFASWCIPCVEEAPVLAQVAGRLPVWGIAYKDRADEAAGFVGRSGVRFARMAADADGMNAIDWGVSGVPESFLVLPGGRIGWHCAGPLTADRVAEELLPALARAGRG